jgi:hypothetical protein
VVCIRISGPDPRGTKSDTRPFSLNQNQKGQDDGTLSFSASGILLNSNIIVTTATLLIPFLKQNQTFQLSTTDESSLENGSEQLIYGTTTDIYDSKRNGWKQIDLLEIKEVPYLFEVLYHLCGGENSFFSNWKIGWSLTTKDPKILEDSLRYWSKLAFFRIVEGVPFKEGNTLNIAPCSQVKTSDLSYN